MSGCESALAELKGNFSPAGRGVIAVDVDTKELPSSGFESKFFCARADPALESAIKPLIVAVAVEPAPGTIVLPSIPGLSWSAGLATNSEDVEPGVPFEVRTAKFIGIR
ncbi:hypothetical protein C0V97_07540 [Asaia sp. W19]|nr:hypothetical protein C0V97_07540 [Asaia sp. W19]